MVNMSICDSVNIELKKATDYLKQNKYWSADYSLDLAQQLIEKSKHSILNVIFNNICAPGLEDKILSLRVNVAEQSMKGELTCVDTAMHEKNYKKASVLLAGIEEYHKKAGVFLLEPFYAVGRKVYDIACPIYLEQMHDALAENKYESAEHFISLLERAARHAGKNLPAEAVAAKKLLSEVPKEKYVRI